MLSIISPAPEHEPSHRTFELSCGNFLVNFSHVGRRIEEREREYVEERPVVPRAAISSANISIVELRMEGLLPAESDLAIEKFEENQKERNYMESSVATIYHLTRFSCPFIERDRSLCLRIFSDPHIPHILTGQARKLRKKTNRSSTPQTHLLIRKIMMITNTKLESGYCAKYYSVEHIERRLRIKY